MKKLCGRCMKLHDHDFKCGVGRFERYRDDEAYKLRNNRRWWRTRDEALDALVQMVLDRSHLHFTRSTVVDSETISWDSEFSLSINI